MKTEKVKTKAQLLKAFEKAKTELQAAALKHDELSDLHSKAEMALTAANVAYSAALREYAPSVGIPAWKVK